MFNQPLFNPQTVSDLAACERDIENYLAKLTGQPAIETEGHVPFALDSARATEAFAKWIKSLSMAPGELKKTADLSTLTPVYLPFWVVNSMTYTGYKAERGEHYKETEYYTDANNQSQSRQVTKTRWIPVTGEVHHHFEAVLISGHSGLSDAEVKLLTPKDVKVLERYSPEAAQGKTVEKYNVDPRAGFNKARAVIEGEIRKLIGKNVGGDEQKVNKMETRHVGVGVRHVLIPTYRGAYKFKDKEYKVLINGATGEVTGSYPVSVGKVLMVVLLIVLAVAAIGAALYFFLIKPSMDKNKAAEAPAVVRVASLDGTPPAADDGPPKAGKEKARAAKARAKARRLAREAGLLEAV